MATEKNSFLLYCDIIHTIEKLPDVDAGQLLKHILRYVNDKEPVTENPLVEIAFEPIRQSLKRDLIKYENIRERNSANAKKRWDAKECDRIPNDAKNADSDSDSDSDSVIVIDNINYQALLDFVNKSFGRNFKIVSDKIQRSYKARLKEGYKKEDIIQAIKNCKDNKFHKDNNYQYCTPEYFSRSETLDKYVDRTIVSETDTILANLNR